MDALLASQSGAISIALASRRSLNPGSSTSPAKRSAPSPYLSGRRASRCVGSSLAVRRIGASRAKKTPGGQKS
jgi:hypothetical protein